MGMFDPPEYRNLEDEFAEGELMILYGAEIGKTGIKTRMQENATQSRLTVAKVEAPTERFDVTTLGAGIAAQVERAVPADFPAICRRQETTFRNGRTGQELAFDPDATMEFRRGGPVPTPATAQAPLPPGHRLVPPPEPADFPPS